MSARTSQILSRFPAHLEPARPGKQLVAVTDALAGTLDQLTDRMAAIRRAHRLADADELRDVMLLAGIHGISNLELGVVNFRGGVMTTLAAKLAQASSGPAGDRDAAANAVLDLWGIEGDSRLALFAPAVAPPATPDLAAAAQALVQAVRSMLGYRSQTGAVRTVVGNICTTAAQRGATVSGILLVAANALDLDIDAARNAAVRASLINAGAAGTLNLAVSDGFFHSSDLFWHSTFAINRTPLVRSVPSLPASRLALMSSSINVAQLAAQMQVTPDQVVTQMTAASILPAGQFVSLDLATAEKVAALFQFSVERIQRGTVTMEAAVTVTDLSRQIGVAAGEIIARLAPLGIANAARATEISPDVAVVIARKYGFSLKQRLRPEFELLGIEENPLRRESYPYDGTSKEECFDGHLFKVLRRGFGRELLRAEITGVEERTWGPMIVNRDEGRGVGFFGQVPAGKKLTLSEDGKATLDGSDLTTLAFSWSGACFADGNEPGTRDFVFDSPRAIFAIATPDGALDREFNFPHAGNPVEVPGIGIGVTRMAFFEQEAHLSALYQSQVHAVTPHYAIGFADQSVLAPAESETYPTEAEVVLSWQEHQAYALRVIIPPRFRLLDGGGVTTTDRIAAALERFRPAGVTIRVEYRNDNWVLGQSPVLDQAAADPNLMLMGGTRLSSV